MASSQYRPYGSEQAVVDKLSEMFSKTLDFDIIHRVAQSYQYDLAQATNLLLELSSATTNKEKKSDPARHGRINSLVDEKYQKELELQRVIEFVKDGWKVLILLRGLPGSGKSYLAQTIFNESASGNKKKDFILSTDDYFCKSGRYDFNPYNLQEAHMWNQRRCFSSMRKSVSPIIIDNTNTQLWEMRPYCLMAAEFGYCIEVLEPNTSWATNVHVLAEKNVHQISKGKIIEMLARYERDLTPDKLSRLCNLQFKHALPQRRKIPLPEPPRGNPCDYGLWRRTENNDSSVWNAPSRVYGAPPNYSVPMDCADSVEPEDTNDFNRIALQEYVHEFKTTDHMRDVSAQSKKVSSQTKSSVDELLVLHEGDGNKLSRLESKNESVDYKQNTTELYSFATGFNLNSDKGTQVNNGFPDDTNDKSSNPYSSSNLKAWGVSEDALVSWDVVSPLSVAVNSQSPSSKYEKVTEATVFTENVDRSTNTSPSDFNLTLSDGVKILTSQNRDITFGIVPKTTCTPPKKTLVHKSSMTNEEVLVAALKRGKYTTENFNKLVHMFPGMPKECLMDVYDKCVHDINWTVDLLVENGPGNLCTTKSEDSKETVEANDAGDELADEDNKDLISFDVEPAEELSVVKENLEVQKQQEREQLKKHLEESVDIKKEHYSEKLWQIMNFRRGTPIKPATSEAVPEVTNENVVQTTSQAQDEEDSSVYVSEDECDSNSIGDSSRDGENVVEMNLGRDLAAQLEKMFGDSDVTAHFEPIVQIPESFARQLHALYLESMCRQMENQCDAMEVALREDEAYAKKLQEQEEQSLIQQQHRESGFKEIMDEQFALSLYQRDVDKWKNLSPDDLASKLTRQKLCETFPTIEKELLIEILQAHNNCYKQTIETLLTSMDPKYVKGNRDNLREPPISDTTLQEMKLAQETIAKEQTDETDDRTAVSFRLEANEHMKKRNENLQKVQSYQQRGMPEVAAFYGNIASQQLRLAELANQKATCMFVEENAIKLSNGTTLDLHYLYVKEALPTLDIFIDHHISRLMRKKKVSDSLYIITGRGKRSEGGVSKLKPAVINRLKKRNIPYHQMNLGLLRIKIHKNLLMSTNLQSAN